MCIIYFCKNCTIFPECTINVLLLLAEKLYYFFRMHN